MVKYLLIFGFIFIIGCNDTQEVKRPSKQTYVSPQLITRASSEKGMSENLLAPGLMLLETSLNPSTTIKPEVSIGVASQKNKFLILDMENKVSSVV